jgi:hypothetical protein
MSCVKAYINVAVSKLTELNKLPAQYKAGLSHWTDSYLSKILKV